MPPVPRHSLSMPILTIGREHSAGPRLADALRNLTDDLDELINPESGHLVAEETPDFFRREVTRFLSAS